MKKTLLPMPVMFHPRLSKIATRPSDFLERMNLYASNISNRIDNAEFKLTLLVGLHSADLPGNLSSSYPHLRVIRVSSPTLNFRSFAKRSMVILDTLQIRPNLFIAGDTSLGLLSCFRARSISNLEIPIQISIHGSFFGHRRDPISFAKSFMRIALLRLSLPSVQSVRVVSPEVKQEMIVSFRVDPRKIFIAPIPFSVYPIFHSRDFQSISIGVIGRLHTERNVIEILEILDSILASSRISKVYFLGSGPLKKIVRVWKCKSEHPEKITLEGSLSHLELLNRLIDVDVVISAAVKEGYGLAIREALLSGAIVVARRNEGTQIVMESFQSGIYLYDTVFEANGIISNLLAGDKSPAQCIEGRKIQEAIDHESMKRICESWTAN